MSTYQSPVDFDKQFFSLPFTPTIVNDLDMITDEDQKAVEELLVTTFKGEKLTMMPVCQCGNTKGYFTNITYCSDCGGEVKNDLSQEVFSNLWFRSPTTHEGEVIPLMSPHYWLRIKDLIAKTGFCVMTYLTNTSYRPSTRAAALIGALHKEGVTERGLIYFIRNLPNILLAISRIKAYKPKQAKILEMYEEVVANPSTVLCNHLALPNKTVLVIETNNLGIFIDASVIKAKTAMKLMVGIDKLPFIRNKENRTAKAIDALADMLEVYFETNLKPKPGILRKQLGGGRSNFAARNVLTSITGPHDHEESHQPWCSCVVMLRHHLIGKLTKRGYTLNQAAGLLITHVHLWHKDIDDIFNEFLEESNNKIPSVSQRNPSLLIGSAQYKNITKINRDPLERSMAASILSAKAMNADYDGDFLATVLALDKVMAETFEPLRLHNSVFAFNKPYAVSSLMALPKPDIATIANHLAGN